MQSVWSATRAAARRSGPRNCVTCGIACVGRRRLNGASHRPRCVGIGDMTMLKRACQCAFSDGVPLRSFNVALAVGTVLNLINQGDALLGGAPVSWVKIVLTYLVPYAVCTYGAVSYQLKVRDHSRTEAPD